MEKPREFKVLFDSKFTEPGLCKVTNEAIALQVEVYKFPVEFHVIEKEAYDEVLETLLQCHLAWSRYANTSLAQVLTRKILEKHGKIKKL